MSEITANVTTTTITAAVTTPVITLNLNTIQGTDIDNLLPKTERITLTSTDITNKYVDLSSLPAYGSTVDVFPDGGIRQRYSVDFTIITDGTSIKRLSWDTLSLTTLLETGDIIVVNYLS